ncbi:MAG: hypothetical protein E7539_00110 [Ruminococcaceae bacterium]|nr:hypothetical protein [Oscillospiraceae bacterium]
MKEIARGDNMKYLLEYNPYHNLESIGIKDKTEKLVSYAYKNGTGRLKEVTYANGDTMKASYNGLGQLVSEKWFNSANTLIAHYKYVYDAEGNIVRSIDLGSQKEYTYLYEDGKLIRSTEYEITLDSNEFVVSRTATYSLFFDYNSDGELIRKRTFVGNSLTSEIFYEKNDDSTVVKFKSGGKDVTSHSKSDSFGRKIFDELQLGTGVVSRQFSYYDGVLPDEHKENGKIKSSPVTQLVSKIVLSGGRTLLYEYDNEERITKVTDSVDGTTEYTYDALGQLLTETVNDVAVNTMTYDNYGNILTKNGKNYTYDATWKDLLTSYNGQSITYDAQGNPTSYLGHTLTWEKGRQLKSYDGITFTYNANGIRTSKTVDGNRQEFILEGAKILSRTCGSELLVPLYDNEDSVCGIEYQGTPYYFHKNLQGDIIAIADKDGDIVARYTYDAWGKPISVTDGDGNQVNSVHIANINPFRYRGYYYDVETGLYYVSSRYYNPEIGRFLNSDETSYIYADGINYGVNLFAYCENNPVNMYDPNGTIALLTCVIIGAIAGAAIGAIASKMIYGKVNGWWVLGGAIVGGVLGYFGGAFFGASGIKAGTLASKISMSKVRWLGKIGEKMAKWPKNTTRIKSFTGSAKYRIPDYLNKANKVIGDVKNVKKLSYTKQLQDFMLYAEKYGYTYIIKVRQSTQFSSTIKNLIDAGKIIIMYIK